MFTTTRTSLACSLFMIVHSILCLVNAEAIDSGNYRFSVRALGDKKDASAFSQVCPVERSTITTYDMIACNSYDSTINWCSECYVTNPCQNKYFYMTFKTSVVNHLGTTFYVTVSDDNKNSYNNGIWFGMPDGGPYSSYIRFWSNGVSSNPTDGINLFSAGPKFPYPTDGTSFIMYDQTGIYYGVNGVIGAQSTDMTSIQKVFSSNKLYIKVGSYSRMVATLSDIQVKCLGTDKCVSVTPNSCGAQATNTEIKVVTSTNYKTNLLTCPAPKTSTVQKTEISSTTITSTTIEPKYTTLLSTQTVTATTISTNVVTTTVLTTKTTRNTYSSTTSTATVPTGTSYTTTKDPNSTFSKSSEDTQGNATATIPTGTNYTTIRDFISTFYKPSDDTQTTATVPTSTKYTTIKDFVSTFYKPSDDTQTTATVPTGTKYTTIKDFVSTFFKIGDN
ncbi:hypothetical protein BB560_001923 [Smittium megazygosporum]|uniref:B30.2/SPRY domain-containing protein n=1 Tax=Smittium megazygosporum TaxID=133381 RepID=A0A2T9ZG76_9FUNG|nr:hypothetical protein BB560_001923 [Smittium megazygosporum]